MQGEGRGGHDLHPVRAGVPRDLLRVDRRFDDVWMIDWREDQLAQRPVQPDLIRKPLRTRSAAVDVVIDDDAGQPRQLARATPDLRANGKAKRRLARRCRRSRWRLGGQRVEEDRLKARRRLPVPHEHRWRRQPGAWQRAASEHAARWAEVDRTNAAVEEGLGDLATPVLRATGGQERSARHRHAGARVQEHDAESRRPVPRPQRVLPEHQVLAARLLVG